MISNITPQNGARFFGCVQIIEDDQACWEWNRGTGSHGYGQFYEERGKPLLAHRYAWTLANGEIPKGMHVLHRCDNKKCCRPDHLFLGTQADNMADMNKKGRHAKRTLPPSCGHLDRKHFSKEMCRACYIRNWRKERQQCVVSQ